MDSENSVIVLLPTVKAETAVPSSPVFANVDKRMPYTSAMTRTPAVPSEMPLILMPPRRYPSAAMTKHANKGVSMEFKTLPKYIFSSVPKIGT